MLDLGKYAVTVLSAYGVTIAILAILLAATLVKGRRVRGEMAEIEARMRKNG